MSPSRLRSIIETAREAVAETLPLGRVAKEEILGVEEEELRLLPSLQFGVQFSTTGDDEGGEG